MIVKTGAHDVHFKTWYHMENYLTVRDLPKSISNTVRLSES